MKKVMVCSGMEIETPVTTAIVGQQNIESKRFGNSNYLKPERFEAATRGITYEIVVWLLHSSRLSKLAER